MGAGAFSRDICLIGGAGHVGLPLAMAFAHRGLRTVIYDINVSALEMIRSGQMPFIDEGAPELLKTVLAGGRLEVESQPESISDCRFVILIIGTPVDEHLNPSFTGIRRVLERCYSHLRDGQVLILRSTVFPGITEHVQTLLRNQNLKIEVAFCPERVTQGYALKETAMYPQIISAFNPRTLQQVRDLFAHIAPESIEMAPMEAELCKLMTNAWRYIQFAAVNQFYMIATQNGLDFNRILHGCRHHYDRMKDVPGPGFAAGPCLVKDTMQLAAFSQNSFVLGHSAMLINEGLPAHLISMAKQQADLSKMTAGILGMAFKAECDDARDSLSYKLRKLLTLNARRVLCCDPYVHDKNLAPQEQVVQESDFLFVGVPHRAYRRLKLPPGKRVIDVWNCLPKEPANS